MTIDLTKWGGVNNVTLTDISGSNISDILNTIKNLQQSETKLVNDLDAYTSATGFNSSDPALIEMVNHINNIAAARIAMFQAISSNSNILQTSVSQSRTDLVAQMTLLKAVEDQLTKAKQQIELLNNTNDTKMRMVEINTYYGQRYEAQGNLMKKIILICVPVLVVFILKKKGLIPETISNYIIGIIVAIGGFLLMMNIWDIYTRNNMRFDEYNWNYESPEAQSPSIWQYNKENMFKFDNLFQNLMASLGICVTDKCCAEGTIYSEKKSKCVLPADLAQGFTTLENMPPSAERLIGGNFSPYSPDMAFASL